MTTLNLYIHSLFNKLKVHASTWSSFKLTHNLRWNKFGLQVLYSISTLLNIICHNEALVIEDKCVEISLEIGCEMTFFLFFSFYFLKSTFFYVLFYFLRSISFYFIFPSDVFLLWYFFGSHSTFSVVYIVFSNEFLLKEI